MMGVETEDKVLFIADAMFGSKVLAEYKLPFIYDVAAFKETIARTRTISYELPAQYSSLLQSIF
nr:hypothetical protein [uncultured Desulfobacter sp.]